MGAKAAEMLRLMPKTRVAVIERCSGHGGIWGARTENFETAVKVGKPAAQAAIKNDTSFVASECPLAADHLMQVMEMTAGEQTLEALARRSSHRADGAGLWTDGEAMTPRAIEVSAILPLAEYAKLRAERRRQISEIKKNRRLEVGPFATFYFESYETMLHQVHEMLFIEKGGAAQIPDELAAYNPLIPQGSELVATVMFEIDDPMRRARVLAHAGRRREPGLHSCRRRGRSAACPRAIRNARATTARPRRCSSSAFPSRRPRSRPSAAAPAMSWSASIIPTTATWR